MSNKPNIDQLRRTITADVFAATGRKVDPDDPLVTAALVQAAFMATASELAVSRIQHAADQVAERATKFETVLRAAHVRGDQVQVAHSLAGIADDLRTLPSRRDVLICSIAGSVIGGGIVFGIALALGALR